MSEPDRGSWWHVEPQDGMVVISHGPTINARPLPPRAIIRTSLPAALELAVAIVHAALAIDAAATQQAMLALWLRDPEE